MSYNGTADTGYVPPENFKAKAKRPPFEIFDVNEHRAQICSKLGKKETERRLYEKYPGRWKLAKDYFETDPNPYPCDDNPKTHTHYLYLSITK